MAVPLPTLPSPQSTLNIINTALEAVGFNIQWPATSTLPDGTIVHLAPGHRHRQQHAGPRSRRRQPGHRSSRVRQALVNALLNADCNLASEITVSDIGVGVLAGGGNLNLSLGGANAVTSDAAAVDPFGSVTGLSGSHLAPPARHQQPPAACSTSSAFTPPSSLQRTDHHPHRPDHRRTGTGVKTALGPDGEDDRLHQPRTGRWWL